MRALILTDLAIGAIIVTTYFVAGMFRLRNRSISHAELRHPSAGDGPR